MTIEAFKSTLTGSLDEDSNSELIAAFKLHSTKGALARLCRAVSRRMMPDDPTPEDRLELWEAYAHASAILTAFQIVPDTE